MRSCREQEQCKRVEAVPHRLTPGARHAALRRTTGCPIRISSFEACSRPWGSMRTTRSRCPQTTCVITPLPPGTSDVLSLTNPDMESHSCLARRGTLVCVHQALADYPGTRLVGLVRFALGPALHSGTHTY